MNIISLTRVPGRDQWTYTFDAEKNLPLRDYLVADIQNAIDEARNKVEQFNKKREIANDTENRESRKEQMGVLERQEREVALEAESSE